jgi:hypothetical protein
MCHAVAAPLSAEYWHIGDTTMRLGRARLRRTYGENSVLIVGPMGSVDRSDYQSAVFVAVRVLGIIL